MIFLIFLIISFLSALLPKRKHAIISILLIACVFPSSNAYSQIISLQGVYFYDGFTIAYIVRLFLEFATSGRLKIRAHPFSIATLLLHFVFLAAALMYVDLDKYYIKDIRPVLNIIFLVAVLDLYKKTEDLFDDSFKQKMFVISGAASFVKLFFISSGLYGFQDEYYEENSFRYLDASSYYCAIYLISCFVSSTSKSRLKIISILFSVASVLLANSRFILLSLGISAIGSNLNRPKRVAYAALAAVLLAFSFYLLSIELNATRIIDNLSADRIAEQLLIRFGPAVERINEFSGLNYLFGLGAGTTFEIPWFAYRGLETTHSNIDSAYLTYITKYGLVGFVLLAGFAFTAIPSSKISIPARIFIFSVFLVSATPYQPYCIGLIASFLWVNKK
ncbi:DUF6369 family protein [Marinobacterium rhizophilum]|uniref:DUF6369 family protein n=1 Tax=Marinobacterium rhizophilum TaxID=420402 RepID=UPI00037F992A|nr:DUF6369 family protein [Marinobacterium rhizophilum]